MQCTSCGLHSDNLREYSRAIELGDYRKTISTIFLCAACRVFNAINPKYVMKRVQRHRPDAEPGAAHASPETSITEQRSRERDAALASDG